MRIVIKSIQLKNFKAAQNLTINFQPKVTTILGTNGTMKTSLATAFNWVLTGKDLEDRTDHEIKNTEKPELNRLDHEVVLTLDVDKKIIVLRRVYSETWRRIAGAEEATKTGNTTKYFVNDEPFSAAAYSTLINTWASETTLKMLTNPLFFNTIIKGRWEWRNQRDILTAMAGEITPQEVFDSFAIDADRRTKLQKVLDEGKSFEGYKKELGVKIKAAEDELKKVSNEAISAVLQTKPEIEDWDALENLIIQKDKEYEKINDQIASKDELNQGSTDEINAKKAEITSLEDQIKGIEDGFRNKLKLDNDLIRQEIQDKKNNIERIERQIASIEKQNESNLLLYNKQAEQFESENKAYKARKDEVEPDLPEDQKTCPTCERPLDEEALEIVESTHKEKWRAKKVDDVAFLKGQVKALYDRALGTKNLISSNKLSLDTYKKELSVLVEELEILEKTPLKAKPELDKMIEESVVINELQSTLSSEKLNLVKLQENQKPDEVLEKLKLNRKEIDDSRIQLRDRLSDKKQVEKIDLQVVDMKKKNQVFNQEIATYEGLLFSMKEYGLAKNKLVQVKVNERFEEVEFKMFNTLENGSQEETCELIYKGVPFSTLNTGSKMYAGLCCIKAFNEFYNIYAPVFVDNAESTVKYPEMDTQITFLRVDELEPKLKVLS